MAEDQLKPCPNPWCFSTTAPLPMGLGYEKGWRVACACGIQTFRAETCDEAIAAWNRRAPAVSAERPGREEPVAWRWRLFHPNSASGAIWGPWYVGTERPAIRADIQSETHPLFAHPAPVKADTAGGTPKRVVMPNGDVLTREYDTWDRGVTLKDPQGKYATNEEGWELVESYGLDALVRAMLSAVPATPEGPKEQGSSQSQPVLSPKSDNAEVKSPGEARPIARWQTMDRFGLIDTARNWADRQMVTHDTRSDLAQSVRDAAFYRADALYEFAAHIEDGNFDAVRPDGGEAVHSQPSDQAPDEPSSSTDKTNG